MSQKKKLTIRPYARLLTMLGEQLIKNERIALIELIKNSYDADAEWVKVSFINFGDKNNPYKINQDSKIVIEDSGYGMTREIVEKHWLNPATPEKKLRKKIKAKTPKGRVIQGEKGIGRFAMLKLGRKIDIITRAKGSENEILVSYDFSSYDDDFLSENGESKDIHIDDLSVFVSGRSPEFFVKRKVNLGSRLKAGKEYGTCITISNLKGAWTEKKVKSINSDIARLESIFVTNRKSSFEILIYKDDDHKNYYENYLDDLQSLLHESSVFQIESGIFDHKKLEFRFELNGEPQTISIVNPILAGFNVFQKQFGEVDELKERLSDCGSFNFGFYVFDFSAQAPMKFLLDKNEKETIKNHRIYLYRDGIRVYPYGEPDDDWLRIDVYRGTISAGQFLSNDQVVGHVDITQGGNANLKDKTNREGLIEKGNATEDFIALLQTFLMYIRKKPYARYRKDLEKRRIQEKKKSEVVNNDLAALKEVVSDNKKAQKLVLKVEKEIEIERKYLLHRAETTEDLAGVGLSVETASHDIMGMMSKVIANIDGVIHDLMSGDDISEHELLKELQAVRGGMSFIEAQLKDIQLLFKSSKGRKKPIRVKEILGKVEHIYRRVLKKKSISFSVKTNGSPLVVKSTDAVLLQLFLNLFDNSVYWLSIVEREKKNIEVLLDGENGKMVFSDNGPGIENEDIPYVFEPFYSGKGIEGRGLGLYIARQLLERQDYTIDLASYRKDKVLSGCNFVVDFVAEE